MSRPLTDERIQQFRSVSRQYSDTSVLMHETIGRKAGLAGADHKYLGLLMQKGQMTAGELSQLTGLTTGAVTGLIDRLEKKKLVKREADEKDRRKVMIVPQEQNAMKLLMPLFARLQKKTAALLATFSEKELQVIERYFTAATEIITDVTNDLNTKKKKL